MGAEFICRVAEFKYRPDFEAGNLSEPPAMIRALDNHISWIESKAKEVIDYWSKYTVVSD